MNHLRWSQNRYDWLGHGVYFWENNPERALDFARECCSTPRKGKRPISAPFVVGAVIDPGNCLNLMEARSLRVVRQAFDYLAEISESANVPLPMNKSTDQSKDLLQRYLDCAVIETVHKLRTGHPYDSARGVFTEGAALYPTAGFHQKTHIQICVRNLACIRGYFRLLPDQWESPK